MPKILDLNAIKQVAFNDYYKEVTQKNQIYLHGTAGSASAPATWNWWAIDQQGPIATCVVIAGKPDATNQWKDGEIWQGFSSKYWAWHLGVQQYWFQTFGLPYRNIDKFSIAVEICNWGYLDLMPDGTFRNGYGQILKLKDNEIAYYPNGFKGKQYYQAYTAAQIDSVEALLRYWNQYWGIPIKYRKEIWDIDREAFAGTPGVYTHNSIRKDKSDIHPQPEMIRMLESL